MSQGHFPVTHTEAEWRALLTPEQYAIMREHGTERAGSCALLWEKRPGVFSCAGCGQPLFESKTKFESGTGWPSFNTPVEGAVETSTRPQLGHDPHRGPLRPLRLASRPRLPRRPAADGPALLHQRRGDELHAGAKDEASRSRARGRVTASAPLGARALGAADGIGARSGDERLDPRPGADSPSPAEPSAGPQRPDRRADRQSRHARGHRLLVDAALPEGIPVRPARDRGAARSLVADPRSSSCCGAPPPGGATTPRSGTRSATRGR